MVKKMTAEIVDGYLVMDRKWEESTTIVLDFPMQVREVLADDKVEDDRGKVSLEYGPIVYAVEEVDNKDNFEQLQITPQTNFSVQFEKDLLQGVNTLKFDDFKAIPYYSWSNRGIGKMKVWLKIIRRIEHEKIIQHIDRIDHRWKYETESPGSQPKRGCQQIFCRNSAHHVWDLFRRHQFCRRWRIVPGTGKEPKL